MLGLAAVHARTAISQAPSASGRTVWDGVYTDAQAKRGAAIYVSHCQRCHADTLLGDGEATALTGPGFLGNWDGVALRELADRTRNTMPNDDPGTLSRQQTADVLAYLLNFNKFPAGDVELPTQAEVLAGIKFVATKQVGAGPRFP
jgi:mono/diheme cytochrome c family protein